MARKKMRTQEVREKKQESNRIVIRVSDIKVRKSFAPATRVHKSKKAYRRVSKHRKQD